MVPLQYLLSASVKSPVVNIYRNNSGRRSRHMLTVARNSLTIIANLPKYVVHGRGAIKPPALVPPHIVSLKPMLVRADFKEAS